MGVSQRHDVDVDDDDTNMHVNMCIYTPKFYIQSNKLGELTFQLTRELPNSLSTEC